jgi:hypothetical protein
MRLRKRSFPHPVLGNDDDVVGAAFQAAFEVESDRERYYLIATFECSSTTLNALIETKKAAFVMHVECTNTVFRTRYTSTDRKNRFTVASEDLNGSVEVNFFICAHEDIPGYQIQGAHSDYGDTAFQIRKGDILAKADGRVFEAAQDYDAVKKIATIMQIEEVPEEGALPMRAIYEADRIRILLSKPDYRTYNLLKNNTQLQHAISCGIVLPVLSEAARMARDSTDEDREQLREYRWFRNVSARLEEPALAGEKDCLILAQRLLQLPIRRALEGAATVLED